MPKVRTTHPSYPVATAEFIDECGRNSSDTAVANMNQRLFMTQNEWQSLSQETQCGLLYATRLEGMDRMDLYPGCNSEEVNQEPSNPLTVAGYYIEVGPKSLTLHIPKSTFHWIDEVK